MRKMQFTRPVEDPELMDHSPVEDGELRRTLDFLAWVNRFFGGLGPVLAHLALWSEAWPKGRTTTVLDVGTGGAELPLALLRWSRASGVDLRVTGIDPVPAIAAIARENAAADSRVEILETDLRSLAATGRRFDYVIGSLLLHHIPEAERVAALQAADALAARGVLFVDLRRCRAGYWGARLLTGLFGNRITRHDGPLSVRKGFQARELDALALKAGLTYLRASEQPFFRLSLAGEKEPAHV